MSNKTRGRQKKIEKQKKKRETAKREARARANGIPTGLKGLVRHACGASFGPAWVGGLTDESEGAADITSVVISRTLPHGQLLAQVLLVDRTCLGVKQAMLLPPMDARDLPHRLEEFHEAGIELEPCEVLKAQSVVFHAIDYAKNLGFEPHRDFIAGLVEPRPAELLDTPLARRARPLYVVGPDDSFAAVFDRLVATVGPGNFDFVRLAEGDDAHHEDEGCDCEDCDGEGCEDCACEGCDCEDCDGEGCEDEGCEGCEDCACEGCDDEACACEGCEDCDPDGQGGKDRSGGRTIIDVQPVEVREVEESEARVAQQTPAAK